MNSLGKYVLTKTQKIVLLVVVFALDRGRLLCRILPAGAAAD